MKDTDFVDVFGSIFAWLVSVSGVAILFGQFLSPDVTFVEHACIIVQLLQWKM